MGGVTTTTTTSGGAPRRLTPEQRRTQLLDLGVSLLATRSLDELTIDVLADEAGISRGLLYHYFGNKHDFREAVVRREGSDVTIVGIGWTVGKALAAAEQLAADGIEAEVVDPRTLAPLDVATIVQSVEKTGRLVVVDQATRHASAAAVIAAEAR